MRYDMIIIVYYICHFAENLYSIRGIFLLERPGFSG
jgi:hypothetical protein